MFVCLFVFLELVRIIEATGERERTAPEPRGGPAAPAGPGPTPAAPPAPAQTRPIAKKPREKKPHSRGKTTTKIPKLNKLKKNKPTTNN